MSDETLSGAFKSIIVRARGFDRGDEWCCGFAGRSKRQGGGNESIFDAHRNPVKVTG